MNVRAVLPRIAVAIALCAAAALAQDSSGLTPSAAPKPRILVLGASVSAGFIDPSPRPDGERNSTVKLARALLDLWDREAVEIRDQSDAFLFLDPAASGKRQVDRTMAAEPALIVALDFPFWFGYGRGADTEARLRHQDELFALLETLLADRPVPIVLGDYPDMRGADPRMLPVRLVPSPEELAELNRRFRAWAAERPQVIVFPLADFVRSARGDGITVQFEGAEHVLGSELLMQGDRLHASRTGLAIVVRNLAAALRTGLGDEHPLAPRKRSFEQLAEDVGATFEIEDWLDAQRETTRQQEPPLADLRNHRDPTRDRHGIAARCDP